MTKTVLAILAIFAIVPLAEFIGSLIPVWFSVLMVLTIPAACIVALVKLAKVAR